MSLQESTADKASPRIALRSGVPCHIAFLPDATLKEEEGTRLSSLVTLPHPKEGSGVLYLLVPQSSQLFEVCRFSDEPRCWFAEDTLIKDGSVLMCTPMDPLFLALPYVLRATQGGSFADLDDVLEDHAFPELRLLHSLIPSKQWLNICSTKVTGGSTFYRYDQVRCLRWLTAKVHRLADRLQEEAVDVSQGSRAALLVSSRKQKATKEDHVRFAHGMIAGYLPLTVALVLQEHLGLPSVPHLDRSVSSPSRGSGLEGGGAEDDPPPLKKARSEPLEDYSKCGVTTKAPSSSAQKAGRKSAVERALGKVDTRGMRSLGKFFNAK